MHEHEEWHLLSAYLDQDLDAAQRQGVFEHLSSCQSCRVELDGLKRTKSVLAGAPRRMVPPEILAELERRYAQAPAAQFWRHFWRLPEFRITARAMAAAAILAGLWLGFNSRNPEEIPLGPLLAAHSRYSGETLIPQEDLAASNFVTELALYKGDQE